jgi:hypothetical protein
MSVQVQVMSMIVSALRADTALTSQLVILDDQWRVYPCSKAMSALMH